VLHMRIELRRKVSYWPGMPALACIRMHGGALLSSRPSSGGSLPCDA
jgi:hypothetical protein